MESRFVLAFALPTFGLILASGVSSAIPHPQNATDYATHFNNGGELMRQMHFHDAVSEFREAIRINLNYLPAHQALAVAYALTHCFDLAWQEVTFVREAGGDLNETFVRALSAEISEKDAAAKRAKNALELAAAKADVEGQDKSAAAHARLGRAFASSGDFPAAEAEATAALRINPAEPNAHFVLATILASDPPTDEQSLPHLKLYLQNVPRSSITVPDVIQAYTMLADFYGHRKMEREALIVLEEGLKEDSQNPHLLNNAAWLYATSADASVRDANKALMYAERAAVVTKEQKANILDTLGESFYANGRFDEAVTAEKKAIAISPDNDLYQDQLKKFQNAKQNAASAKP